VVPARPHDGSGDVVVRLYESKRMATRAVLSTALKVRRAVETDMLESPKGGAAIPVRSGRVGLEFRPFEIKTVRLAVVASGRRRSR
jgi:alpha-mannosidase